MRLTEIIFIRDMKGQWMSERLPEKLSVRYSDNKELFSCPVSDTKHNLHF